MAVSQRRAVQVEESLRVGAFLFVAILIVYWTITLMTGDQGQLLPTEVPLTVAIIASLGASMIAIRQPRGRNLKRLAVESSAMVILGAVAICLAELHTHWRFTTAYAELTILMVGYAMLLPMPLRIGIPVLTAIAATFPATQLLSGNASVLDLGFAVHTTHVVAGLTLAVVVLALHNQLFEARFRALGELARLADTDPLTQAYNRRTLTERLIAETDRCHRYEVPFGVLMYDVDRFKRFNTEHGFAAGDAMLIAVVKAIRVVLQAPEFERLHGTVARYGGEEFVVILPDADADAAARFAERSRARIEEIVESVDGADLRTTVSVGAIAIDPSVTTTAAAVLAAADHAMYTAKATGGNAVHIATKDDLPSQAPDLENVAGSMIGARIATADSDSVENDLSHIHVAGLKLLAAIGTIWIVLFGGIDVAVFLDNESKLPINTIFITRMIGVIVIAAFGLIASKITRHTRVITAMHALLIFGGGAASIWSMTFTGGLYSPYLIGSIFAVLTWSLAFSAPFVASVAVVSLFGCLMPSYFVVFQGISPMDPELIARSGTIFAAGSVAVAAQRSFSRLRREELATRFSLRSLGRIDPLTGLGNRTAFVDGMTAEVARASVVRPLTIIMFDLDHFKKLNDTLGHLMGDRALVGVALVVQDALRGVDVAARIGGEEFVVALPHTGLDAAMQVAERLRKGMHTVKVGETDWSISASFGVAPWAEGATIESMLADADDALRKAKQSGRDTVVAAQADDGDALASDTTRDK